MQRVRAAAGLDDGGAGVAEKLGQRRRDPLVILDKQQMPRRCRNLIVRNLIRLLFERAVEDRFVHVNGRGLQYGNTASVPGN